MNFDRVKEILGKNIGKNDNFYKALYEIYNEFEGKGLKIYNISVRKLSKLLEIDFRSALYGNKRSLSNYSMEKITYTRLKALIGRDFPYYVRLTKINYKGNKECYINLADIELQKIFRQFRIHTNEFPNDGSYLTKKFKKWIELNFDNEKRDRLLNKYEIINKDKEIYEYIVGKSKYSNLNQIQIKDELRRIGLDISRETIRRVCFVYALDKDKFAYKKRFPKPPSILNNDKKLCLNDLYYNSLLDKELQNTFKRFYKYTKKIGEEKFPNPYPNLGAKITNKFKKWVRKNYPPKLEREIIQKVEKINRNYEIYKFIIDHVKNTKLNQVEIRNKLKKFGILISLFTIRKIAFSFVFKENLDDYKKRFINYRDPLSEDKKIEIINSIISQSKLSISDIAYNHSVAYPTVSRLAIKEVFNDDIDAYRERFPLNEFKEMGKISHDRVNDILTVHFNRRKIYYFSDPQIIPNPPHRRVRNKYKPDGFLLNIWDQRFLYRRLVDNEIGKQLARIIGLKTAIIKNVKAFIFEFTSDLSRNNIIAKIKKYQHPEIFLFIVGIRWHNGQIKELPQDEAILYKNNIRIISPYLFAKLIDLKGVLLENFKDILFFNLEWDLDSLRKIPVLDKKKIYRTNKLKSYLIKKSLIKKEIHEFFNKKGPMDEFI